MIGYHSDDYKVLEGPARPLLVFVTLFVALVLNLVPYSDTLFEWKPDFVALILVYWCLHSPRVAGFAAGVLLGALMDLAYTAALGQHVIAYSVLVFLALRWRVGCLQMDLFRQAIQVGVILVASKLALFSVSHLLDGAEAGWQHLQPEMIAVGLWLLLPLFVGFVRNRLAAFAG